MSAAGRGAIRMAPSLLSADFGRLAEDLAMLEEAGADWLHVDVMDGVFVPNLTFGAKVIETCRKLTRLPLDVHLMAVEPEKYFDPFAKAGAAVLTVHVEATPHLHRQVMRIKELGAMAGATMNPSTSLETVREVAHDLDLLLVMSVNPGFGGQKFIPGAVGKIARARALLDETRSHALLEVDGGIARETIAQCWRAGADTFVAGNAIFSAKDPKAEVAALRRLCAERA
jgi:ribulose-phosphate 3-epimerase